MILDEAGPGFCHFAIRKSFFGGVSDTFVVDRWVLLPRIISKGWTYDISGGSGCSGEECLY